MSSFYGNLVLNGLLYTNSGVDIVDGPSNFIQVRGNITLGSYTITANTLTSNIISVTTLINPSLTANAFVYTDSNGYVTGTVSPTNGQLLIGSTGNTPQLASLTAGSGITITPGVGSITIDTSSASVSSVTGTVNQITANVSTGPVGISLSSNITITSNITLSGLTANAFVCSNVGGLITSTSAPTTGQLLMGNTDGNIVLTSLVAGTNTIITNKLNGDIMANADPIGVWNLTQTVDQVLVTDTTGNIIISVGSDYNYGGIPMRKTSRANSISISNGVNGVPISAGGAVTVWQFPFADTTTSYDAEWFIVMKKTSTPATFYSYRAKQAFYGNVTSGVVTQAPDGGMTANNYVSYDVSGTYTPSSVPTIVVNSPTGYISWTAGDSGDATTVKIIGVFYSL